jgi:polysaccharide pyruvyl transferase WcaK-like protein
MRIAMFFHGGSLNRGCEAIVRSGVAIIKNQNPVVKVDLFSMDPNSDKIIPLIDSIFLDKYRYIKNFSIPWFISAIKIKFFKDESYYYRFAYRPILDKLNDYDIFLSIGGDNYCYGEQPGIYELDRCIKKSGKKLVLWGASIGEEDLSIDKINDLKLFDLILARESITSSLLKKNGIENVKLCSDGAFTMEKEELPLPEGWQIGNTIGFNFRPVVWKKNINSKKAAIDLVNHILTSTNMTIALTPHVIIPGNNDYDCLNEFYEKFKSTGKILLLPNNLNAIQYKGYISRMRFFIGARTHATIAAYSSLIPTMVLGYSVKSRGIAKDIFGEEKLVLNLDELSDSQKLIEKFEEMVFQEKEIHKELQKRMPIIKKMSHKAAEILFQIL